MKKLSLIAVLVIALLVAFVGCAPAATTEESEAPSAEATEAPVEATEAPAEATEAPAGLSGEIAISGSTSVFPAMEEIKAMFNVVNPDVVIDLQAGGSSVGVKQAGSGEVDLGMASRDLKDAEKEEFDGIQATVLCLDGVAIVVNAENGVEDLTAEQVKAMYTGEITDWSEVGGEAGTINLVTRDSSSGTREAFEGLFLGKDDAGEQIEIDETICAAVVNSNGAVAQTVEGDTGAIGYMSLGIVPEYPAIKATKVDSVVASTDNMKAGTYTYYRNFNLITVGAPADLVAALVEFCTTPDVATYLESKGYVMPAGEAAEEEAVAFATGLSGEIAISGSTSVFPAMEEIKAMFAADGVNPDVEIDLQAGGSSVGVKQAGSEEVDLGMASRDLKDAEKEEFEGIQATVLCLDGVAIVVNAENAVEDLTKDQVKAMYMGEITDWSEVGGEAGTINLVTRDSSSGTREAFEGLFLGKDDAGEQIEIDETICAAVVNSNGAVAQTVEGDTGAIGYMSLGIVPEYPAIKATKVDSVVASTDNMKAGTYTYYRNFNLITMGAPEGNVAELLNFCKSADVVTYLEGKGYVMPK